MITRVVVPLDGSPLAVRALEPARSLAERSGASLVLMTTRWRDEEGEASEHLEKQASQLAFDRVETRIVHDRFAREAILLEGGEPGTVVCMSTHGRTGLGQAVLGSMAAEVLRGSDRPVLLVGPSLADDAWDSARAFDDGNLVVTIDGSEASEAVVPVAGEWARLLGLRSCVAEVLPTPVGILPRPRTGAKGGESARRVAEHLPDVGGGPRVELLHGPDVAASLLEYISQLPATLVAMASHGRTGLARLALGSVAARVLHRSPCPVLLSRPQSLVEGP